MIEKYLDLAYRRAVLGQRVDPDLALPVEDDAKFIAALEAELARIRKLGLGARLASRDFALYQNQRAIEAALAKFKERKDAIT